ncbi:MAG: pyrroline-5-carboxylate reductase, partial [Phycisphaerae bacterium]|nr:pyrroline-5-carboxylate reductase [Phycisphaerae bacterium]
KRPASGRCGGKRRSKLKWVVKSKTEISSYVPMLNAAGCINCRTDSMPNTPMLVAKGITAIAPGTAATEQDLTLAEEIFDSCGQAVRVEENLIDAVTAVSGSGPAYFFYLVEAMEQAAVNLGLSASQARDFVSATFEGSAELLTRSGQSAEALRRKVTSPGGTTEAAVGVLEGGKFKGLINRAIRAAADRSKELSE